MIRRPNYFRCRKILADLHKFQDLILHHQRWAGDLELARPLKELIPDLIDNGHAHLLIRKEINKLIPIIRRYLDYAQIETKISVTDRGVVITCSSLGQINLQVIYRLINTLKKLEFNHMRSIAEDIVGIRAAKCGLLSIGRNSQQTPRVCDNLV